MKHDFIKLVSENSIDLKNMDTKHPDLLEIQRLEAVARYQDFHKNREKDLQEIVQLASKICTSPIAMITLMGEQIQWIKVKVGADVFGI